MQKVSKGTIIRTALLVLALANNALALAGKSPLPIDDAAVTEAISFLFTAGAAVAAWWRNNSFSAAAIEADNVMRVRKDAESLKKMLK